MKNPDSWRFDLGGFARAIASKREVCGLTMREAASECGLSAATISRVETRQGMPDIENTVSICQWLGLTLDAFVIRERKP